ncbi:MAG: prepilin-type N-terminal cleavage/methylation domain-containing protein [Coriobacteriia bacterium]|nr:prepilin-type N-terminal cleavage/methylation domain-containing protein [Coriobacteriia bacterium]
MSRYAASGDDGFTLTEMMIVTVLMGIVMSAAYLLLNSTTGMANQLEAQTIARDEGRLVMNRLSNELRQAYQISDTQMAFDEAAPRICTFFTDVDRDGIPEKVRYRVVGDKIYRAEVSAASTLPPYTFPALSTVSEQPIIGVVESSWAGSLFSFYDNEYPKNKLGVGSNPLTESELAEIAAVDIRLVNKVVIGNKTATSDVGTFVKVRAIQNEID